MRDEHCVGARFVTRAKKARSALRGGQGSAPRKPRPREGVVATIRVKGTMAMLGWRMLSNDRNVDRADVLIISLDLDFRLYLTSTWST